MDILDLDNLILDFGSPFNGVCQPTSPSTIKSHSSSHETNNDMTDVSILSPLSVASISSSDSTSDVSVHYLFNEDQSASPNTSETDSNHQFKSSEGIPQVNGVQAAQNLSVLQLLNSNISEIIQAVEPSSSSDLPPPPLTPALESLMNVHKNSAFRAPVQAIPPAFFGAGQAMPLDICNLLVNNYTRFNFVIDDWSKHEDVQNLLQYIDRAGPERTLGQLSFIRSLDSFSDLHLDDQENLIKGAWLELFLVRMLTELDDTGQFLLKYDKLGKMKAFPSCDVLFCARDLEMKQRFHQVAMNFGQWRKDLRLMLLVYAITLFNPKRVHRADVVGSVQQRFYKLMLHYLVFMYQNPAEAETSFMRINQLISEIRCVAMQLQGIFGKEENEANVQVFWQFAAKNFILKEILTTPMAEVKNCYPSYTNSHFLSKK